jgi:hypothetical protein
VTHQPPPVAGFDFLIRHSWLKLFAIHSTCPVMYIGVAVVGTLWVITTSSLPSIEAHAPVEIRIRVSATTIVFFIFDLPGALLF